MAALLQVGDVRIAKHSVLWHGRFIDMCIPSWIHSDGSVRWEIPAVLESVGYNISGKYRPHMHVRDQHKEWVNFWDKLDLGSADNWGGSPASAAQKTTEEVGDEEREGPEFWLSTCGLLSLFMHWYEHRRIREQREQSWRMLELFLERTVSTGAVVKLEPHRWRDVNHKCQRSAVLGICSCAADSQRRYLEGTDREPHDKLSTIMFDLWETFQQEGCAACAGQIKALVCELSAEVEAAFYLWGEGVVEHLHRLERVGPSGRKRCRTNHFVKKLALEAEDPTSAEKLRVKMSCNTLRWWRNEQLRYIVATNFLTCQDCHVFSSCFDAGRCGRPAMDLLLHHGFHHRALAGIAFPFRVL